LHSLQGTVTRKRRRYAEAASEHRFTGKYSDILSVFTPLGDRTAGRLCLQAGKQRFCSCVELYIQTWTAIQIKAESILKSSIHLIIFKLLSLIRGLRKWFSSCVELYIKTWISILIKAESILKSSIHLIIFKLKHCHVWGHAVA
jgi:hypothetical protein